jgi:hypothetical protein
MRPRLPGRASGAGSSGQPRQVQWATGSRRRRRARVSRGQSKVGVTIQTARRAAACRGDSPCVDPRRHSDALGCGRARTVPLVMEVISSRPRRDATRTQVAQWAGLGSAAAVPVTRGRNAPCNRVAGVTERRRQPPPGPRVGTSVHLCHIENSYLACLNSSRHLTRWATSRRRSSSLPRSRRRPAPSWAVALLATGVLAGLAAAAKFFGVVVAATAVVAALCSAAGLRRGGGLLLAGVGLGVLGGLHPQHARKSSEPRPGSANRVAVDRNQVRICSSACVSR